MLKTAKARLKPHEKHAILYMLRHMLYGTLGGFSFGIMLLYLDVGGLWSLILTSNDKFLALFLLFLGLFITFGSFGMAAGVMMINSEEE